MCNTTHYVKCPDTTVTSGAGSGRGLLSWAGPTFFLQWQLSSRVPVATSLHSHWLPQLPSISQSTQQPAEQRKLGTSHKWDTDNGVISVAEANRWRQHTHTCPMFVTHIASVNESVESSGQRYSVHTSWHIEDIVSDHGVVMSSHNENTVLELRINFRDEGIFWEQSGQSQFSLSLSLENEVRMMS